MNYLLSLFLLIFSILPLETTMHLLPHSLEKSMTPRYLYKILSIEDWEKSQSQAFISLTAMDKPFIHLATKEQLDKILEKYWGHAKEYVVLMLDRKSLPGELRFESNPGGETKYYHLYNGSLPLQAVVTVNIIKK